jgi:hypothetical protein
MGWTNFPVASGRTSFRCRLTDGYPVGNVQFNVDCARVLESMFEVRRLSETTLTVMVESIPKLTPVLLSVTHE